MRYYYTDPLAAAWMAKHFGMSFDNGDSLRSACEMYDRECEDMPFVVHPNSLHILEPQISDIVIIGNEAGILSRGICDAGIIWAIHYPDGSVSEDGEIQIIQRDGIAFMWPEREE